MKTRLLLAAVTAAFALSGCDADLTTTVNTATDPARTVVALTLTGDAAEAVQAKPELDQKVLETVALLSGGRARRAEERGAVTYEADLDPSETRGDVTGVAEVKVERAGDGTVSVVVRTVSPRRLVAAIEKATETSPDAKALALSWKKSLLVRIRVNTAGRIVSSEAPPQVLVQTTASSVEFSAPLNEWPESLLTVSSARPRPVRTYIAVAATVALLAALLLRRRR